MKRSLVWFQRDLRLRDNLALAQAFCSSEEVLPIYILDTSGNTFLGEAQHWWLHHSLLSLKKKMRSMGLELFLFKGKPEEVIIALSKQHEIEHVYWNRCYEPLSLAQEARIKKGLESIGVGSTSYNSSLLIEPLEVKNQSGGFFKVFTPFWKHCISSIDIPSPVVLNKIPACIKSEGESIQEWNLQPKSWGGGFADLWEPGEDGAIRKLETFIHKIEYYARSRDIPGEEGTSMLSPHLHFGEISVWDLYRAACGSSAANSMSAASVERFIAEIGWREFSYYLLQHKSDLADSNFRAEFDDFPWEKDDEVLTRWQSGETGYPIVDAGMRQLWKTGYMHNRVRMIVASFLTKHLLIDWRQGAKWFLDTLFDADLASNSASWQWVAGSGADAAPYFRIFNPILQGQKFDSEGKYVRTWVRELEDVQNKFIHSPWECPYKPRNYVSRVVEHDFARKRAMDAYNQMKATMLK